MCKAPKMPTPPAPLPAPQPAKNPVAVPTRRKRSGIPGSAGYVANDAAPSMLGASSAPTGPARV